MPTTRPSRTMENDVQAAGAERHLFPGWRRQGRADQRHEWGQTSFLAVRAHGILRRKAGISNGSPSKGSGGAIGGASATGRDDIESGPPIGCGRMFAVLMRASSGRSMLMPATSFRRVSAMASARCLASSRLTHDKIGNVQAYVSPS